MCFIYGCTFKFRKTSRNTPVKTSRETLLSTSGGSRASRQSSAAAAIAAAVQQLMFVFEVFPRVFRVTLNRNRIFNMQVRYFVIFKNHFLKMDQSKTCFCYLQSKFGAGMVFIEQRRRSQYVSFQENQFSVEKHNCWAYGGPKMNPKWTYNYLKMNQNGPTWSPPSPSPASTKVSCQGANKLETFLVFL